MPISKTSPEAQGRIIDPRKRSSKRMPEEALKRGLHVSHPGELIDAHGARRLLKSLFGISRDVFSANHLKTLRRDPKEARRITQDWEALGCLPLLNEGEKESLVHWLERIGKNHENNISCRTSALKNGCMLEGGIDPLLRALEQYGPRLGILTEFTQRLFTCAEFLQNEASPDLRGKIADLPVLLAEREIAETESHRAAIDHTLQKLDDAIVREFQSQSRAGFNIPSISQAANPDEQLQIEKTVLMACQNLLAHELNRGGRNWRNSMRVEREGLIEAIWTTIQNLKLDNEALRELQQQFNDLLADVEAVGSGARRDGTIKITPPNEVLLPVGSLSGEENERRTVQMGRGQFTGKLLVLPQSKGYHRTINLPTWLTQRIMDEARKLRYSSRTRGRGLIRIIHNHINTLWNGGQKSLHGRKVNALPLAKEAAEKQFKDIQEMKALVDLTDDEADLEALQHDLNTIRDTNQLQGHIRAGETFHTLTPLKEYIHTLEELWNQKTVRYQRRIEKIHHYAQLLFGLTPEELCTDDFNLEKFIEETKEERQLHREVVVYQRLLGFHVASIIQKYRPDVLTMKGDGIDFRAEPAQLLAASRLEVVMETLRSSHDRKKYTLRVPTLGGSGAGRIGTLLRADSELPRLIFFCSKTALFNGKSPEEILKMLIPERASTPLPPSPTGEPNPNPEPERESEYDPASFQPVPEPEEAKEEITDAEMETIVDYRAVYARYVFEELSRIRTMAECIRDNPKEFPTKDICIIESREIGNTDPYDDSIEWFDQKGYQKPSWSVRSPEAMQEADAPDRVLATIEKDEDLIGLQQAYDRMPQGGVIEISFLKDPPTDDFLSELRKLGNITFYKKCGQKVKKRTFNVIQDKGATGAFAKEFKEYLYLSMKSMAVIHIEKGGEGAKPLNGLRNVLDSTQRLVTPEERKMVKELGGVFDLLIQPERARQVRFEIAYRLLMEPTAEGLYALAQPIYLSLIETAINVIAQSTKQSDIEAINNLLMSICTGGPGSIGPEETLQEFQARMKRHPAYALLGLALEAYLEKSEAANPPIHLSVLTA